jgi:hypothetical protein
LAPRILKDKTVTVLHIPHGKFHCPEAKARSWIAVLLASKGSFSMLGDSNCFELLANGAAALGTHLGTGTTPSMAEMARVQEDAKLQESGPYIPYNPVESS